MSCMHHFHALPCPDRVAIPISLSYGSRMTETKVTYRGVKILVADGDNFIGSHLIERLSTAHAGLTALALYNIGTDATVSIGAMVGLVHTRTAMNKLVEPEAVRISPKDPEARTLRADAKQLHTATGRAAGTVLGDGLRRTTEWWHTHSAAGKLRGHDAYVL